MPVCTHLDKIKPVSPHTPQGCEECLKNGDSWVHLRLCLQCGHVSSVIHRRTNMLRNISTRPVTRLCDFSNLENNRVVTLSMRSS